MKVLYLLTQDPSDTLRRVMDAHEKDHEVSVLDLRQVIDYPSVVRAIDETDRVISW